MPMKVERDLIVERRQKGMTASIYLYTYMWEREGRRNRRVKVLVTTYHGEANHASIIYTALSARSEMLYN